MFARRISLNTKGLQKAGLLGGLKGFLKWLKENPDYMPDFYMKVLPALMPKKTALEVSEQEGRPVEFTNLEAAARIAYISEKAIKRKKELEAQEKKELPHEIKLNGG